MAPSCTEHLPVNMPLNISAKELHQRLERGDAIQLVDVREASELETARLPYPVLHPPLSRSQEWLGDLERHLKEHRPIAVICHAGVRSWHFACWLSDQHRDKDVWNLQGGIEAWSLQVDPSVPRY